ncbi:phosphotransferase family protein [Ideonella sp. DXS22W]|uniref:Phosphotransferase family protein n=1 Tax=Pseudaquabacterium inlustre TaxID=2984192 RepID=A0ABU9CMN8_9BURK
MEEDLRRQPGAPSTPDAAARGPLPGFDVPRVEDWLRAHVPQLSPPLQWHRLEGGHSNLTYLLTDGSGQRAVIRRPPQGELLPKAHDMAREWALISALGATSVPVPQALGFCEDLSVTGAHFYVMGHVAGLPFYTAAEVDERLPLPLRPVLGESFIDVLADLHAVDPDAVGLSGLGKKDDYIGRQLKTWYRSWQASIGPAQLDDERAHALLRYLSTHVPEQGPARIVHGDYGLHNTLIGTDGRVAAVVDWEISTLGDPLADLAYALNQWAEPGDPPSVRGEPPTSRPGFPPRAALADRYAQRTGRDLSRLDFYVGFNRWKSACIVHGVYARYLEGKKSTAGVDLDALKASIFQSLALAEQAVERLERHA